MFEPNLFNVLAVACAVFFFFLGGGVGFLKNLENFADFFIGRTISFFEFSENNTGKIFKKQV